MDKPLMTDIALTAMEELLRFFMDCLCSTISYSITGKLSFSATLKTTFTPIGFYHPLQMGRSIIAVSVFINLKSIHLFVSELVHNDVFVHLRLALPLILLQEGPKTGKK
ncbi:PREDICTED: uncharacterized protein LOC104719145 isoform X2 [Camelina sativa]|uniref:Uncharacterized protein LOC104719145 isoform X2 n=1 Tax=Camelina sativa TaxID=90675 RepID=A0ABM0U3L6_CAMSA|nr:PREDICTED: uncharacterized protein LOC104719145 isoform X2 [Camelina sativa]